ncbi:MAG: entericidin A/B family lipoprotein [Candidatus Competibacteraceae bacterium]|nr:entericidin A/B family lipoprotein [Candidatus Competibacteraceae bacterium]
MKRALTTGVLLLSALLLAVGHLSGCNTVKGAGQDLKSAGQAIERKAEQKKPY